MPQPGPQEQGRERTTACRTPLILISLTLLVMALSHTFQLMQERRTLQNLIGDQDGAVAESRKIRQQLDSIASGTAKLAAQGNPNARQIVQQLEQRGIRIKISDTATDP